MPEHEVNGNCKYKEYDKGHHDASGMCGVPVGEFLVNKVYSWYVHYKTNSTCKNCIPNGKWNKEPNKTCERKSSLWRKVICFGKEK